MGWWLQPYLDAQHPSAGSQIAWHRPEWREADCGPVCANRVRSGDDAFSPDVVWSSPFDTFDAWGLYTIRAAARASTVTVFTRSTPLYGSQHNDIYLDDASLVAVGAGGVNGGATNVRPPTPVPGFTYPPPSPAPTLSPSQLPGAFAYVVQLHDNLSRLSVRFGISIARIKQLNGLVSDIIRIGHTLIIAP